MHKRTKIIATVGPVTASREQLIALAERGVNVIRFNFSHADHTTAREIAERIHAINSEGVYALSLLLDTKGPEIRSGDLSEKINFTAGEEFPIFLTGSSLTAEKVLTCDYPFLIEDVAVGGIIEIDSGLFHVEVIAKASDHVRVRALNSALIGSRRHINLPWVRIRLPSLPEKDKEDILFGIQNNFHFIAASFIRSAENVAEIRSFLDANGGSEIRIISKIENQEGIDNLEAIVSVSDGVMVARGDLGIEVPIQKVPKYQKRIIDLCRQSGKFVIVATHMLESMIEFPFPTRAEVSDIFRAVLQGTDATMLSGETTTGKYPLESVEMMRNVIVEAEQELEHKHHDFSNVGLTPRDIEKKLLIRSALQIAEDLDITTVILFTKSGRLARLAAAYRPNIRILAFTWSRQSHGAMHILFGIESHVLPVWWDHQSNLASALQILASKGSFGGRIIAITDRVRDSAEIPSLEIISL